MGKIVLTCALALVFGFGGAAGAVTALHGSLQGPQGETGLTGAPGPQGPAGQDGANGLDGATGRAGKPGKAAKSVKLPDPKPVDLGIQGCTGRAVQVVTDVTVTKKQQIQLTKKNVCVVN